MDVWRGAVRMFGYLYNASDPLALVEERARWLLAHLPDLQSYPQLLAWMADPLTEPVTRASALRNFMFTMAMPSTPDEWEYINHKCEVVNGLPDTMQELVQAALPPVQLSRRAYSTEKMQLV